VTDKYLEFVQETARTLGKEFFIDSGEGHDWGQPDDEWYVEDLSGWLVDENEAEAFQKVLEDEGKQGVWERYGQSYCLVYWTLSDNPGPGDPLVTVRFEIVPDP
jgi:hypothetical protein